MEGEFLSLSCEMDGGLMPIVDGRVEKDESCGHCGRHPIGVEGSEGRLLADVFLY